MLHGGLKGPAWDAAGEARRMAAARGLVAQPSYWHAQSPGRQLRMGVRLAWWKTACGDWIPGGKPQPEKVNCPVCLKARA
jgi:hypothetical protein